MTRGWTLFFSRRSEMCNMWSEYLCSRDAFQLGSALAANPSKPPETVQGSANVAGCRTRGLLH